MQQNNQKTFLKDYIPVNCTIKHCELHIDLDGATNFSFIKSSLTFEKCIATVQNIFLDADELEFISIFDEQNNIPPYILSSDGIEIDVSKYSTNFKIIIQNRINPYTNTKLMGLFISNDKFFTQCEAQGFRRITYFMDRPDVMATYDVYISANKNKYPVLLSNGNLISQKYNDDICTVHWQDPFPKPCYLFALVAGKLVCNERYIEVDGQKKHLQVWVEEHDLDKTDHAMNSLIKSIRWDEKYYQRKLDLDKFMIVAVSDFNMGAMENKGLNIFNAKYVLANPSMATDRDFFNIESIVAHEYLHNWTGNRITCRDWFQLSLKEGLTVFRDQCFSATQNNPDNLNMEYDVERIKNVIVLKQGQFIEDAGSMRHPVQPQEYEQINNFYTSTIYQKGAEVVRMYHTILGEDNFQKGMQLYFARHDGQAVTCQDFLQCMMDANNIDLNQLNLWYKQSGTPTVEITTSYDEEMANLIINFKQYTPTEPLNQAFLIPIKMALIDSNGVNTKITIQNTDKISQKNYKIVQNNSVIIYLDQKEQQFIFNNVKNVVVPSFLQGFSAPINIKYDYTTENLLHILKHDKDSFNRWDSCNKLFLQSIYFLVLHYTQEFIHINIDERPLYINKDQAINFALEQQKYFLPLFEKLNNFLQQFTAEIQTNPNNIKNNQQYAYFLSLLISIPSINNIIDYCNQHKLKINLHAIHLARQSSEYLLAHYCKEIWLSLYQILNNNIPSKYNYEYSQLRTLQNTVLYYGALSANLEFDKILEQQFETAQHLTNKLSAVQTMVKIYHPQTERFLKEFYQQAQNSDLLMDKYFAICAHSVKNSALDANKYIIELIKDKNFKINNPNKVYSLLGSYFSQNPAFHTSLGYKLWLEKLLELDTLNPQIASSIAKMVQQVHIYEEEYKNILLVQIKQALHQVKSIDVKEVIGKIYTTA